MRHASGRAVRRRGSGALTWVGRLLLMALGVVLVWSAGLVRFVDHVASLSAPAMAVGGGEAGATEAIVVLTGGSGRLSRGVELLERGVGFKLFISGVYRGIEVRELLALTRTKPGGLECCIDLGYEARTTRGNASETAAWMAERGYRSMTLVTANYHMPRSLLEFRSRLPGAVIVAHPVAPARVHLVAWWRWPGSARLLAGEYNKFLLAWVRLRGADLAAYMSRAAGDGAAASQP